MRRWHQDYPRIHREWKRFYISLVEHHVNYSANRIGKNPYEMDSARWEHVGRFRKRHAFDCGNTRCGLCHGDKYPKRYDTYQEWCADLKFKEGLEELKKTL